MMVRARFLGGLTCAAGALVAPARAADAPPLDATAILARASAGGDVQSYVVPATFQVHMLRPIGARGTVAGNIYYQAPSEAALTITNAPAVIGGFFKGTYKLDLAPQTWAAKYEAVSVTQGRSGNVDAYLVQALPRPRGDVDHVTFAVALESFAPLAATWNYQNGSSIVVTIKSASPQYLPRAESIEVSMPNYALEATCAFGDYALNAPIPKGIFS